MHAGDRRGGGGGHAIPCIAARILRHRTYARGDGRLWDLTHARDDALGTVLLRLDARDGAFLEELLPFLAVAPDEICNRAPPLGLTVYIIGPG